MSATIRIHPLIDPVIDTIGHDPRSLYVELFWLPTLGPTALLFLRRMAALFEESPEGVEICMAETSRSLGLGDRLGRQSPLSRSLTRLVQFDLAAAETESAGSLSVRRFVPPVNRRHMKRLPESLQRVHDDWANACLAQPPLAAARRNARHLASILTELGGDLAHVERALVAAGFHPAICWESALWARERHRAAPPQPDAELPAPPPLTALSA